MALHLDSSMTPEEIAVLIERAQSGDQAAFYDLVTHTMGDVRLFIASHVATTMLGDTILHETYSAIQRELARCPKHDVSAWMCRMAATQLTVRLGDAMRATTTDKDPLIQLMLQNSSESLAKNLTGINQAALELPRRLQLQPPSLRQLLQRHYHEGLTVATIAEKQGLAEEDVAQALMTARARMDWTGVAEVSDTADKTFPRVVEDFLSETLVPDTRSHLVTGVLQDPARATQFQRQVRLHFLLQTLLTPFVPAQVKEFIASLPRHEGSRRLVAAPRLGNATVRTINRRSSSSALRLRDATQRTTRQPQEPSAVSRGQVGSSAASASTSSAVTTDENDFGEDAPPPASRLPLYLGLGAAALGLLALIIMKSQPSMAVQTVTNSSAQPATTVGDSLTEGRGQSATKSATKSATSGRDGATPLASGNSAGGMSPVPVPVSVPPPAISTRPTVPPPAPPAPPEAPVAPPVEPVAPPAPQIANALAPNIFVPTDPVRTLPIGPPGYVWCAPEGGSFELSEVSDVAYGRDDRFFYLPKQLGVVVFSPATFGGDPVPNFHKAGFYKPASSNVVSSVANITPPVIPREIPKFPQGSVLQGAVAPAALIVNLSEQGSTDWIHYGVKDATSFVRHQGGCERLSVARTVDNAPIARYDDNQGLFAWNNGNAPAIGMAIKTGWSTENRGKGFAFTVPADPVLRRLTVWVGGQNTQGIFTATLSDGSAPVYRDDSIRIGAAKAGYAFTLWYRAKQAGVTLTIGYRSAQASDGHITLQAAALTEYDEGQSHFIKAVNFGGNAVQIAGNQWTAQKAAESTDLVIYNSRRVTSSGDPIPMVDAAMKELLKTGAAAKSTDLEINQRVANGRYNVTLYVMETGPAKSRMFDVTLNDASLQGIGQLPKNGWEAYGPLTATVTKGVLALMAKAKKGSPQFMGMSIFTVVNGAWTNAFPAGQAHDVPGTWLFADFDRGANGVAFQEREDVQIRPMYRSEAVTVQAIHGVPVVAEVSGGEWLRYTMNAKTAGTYAVTVKYSKVLGANALKSRVECEVDGKAVGNAMELEDTGGWDTAKASTLSGISLTAGIHDLRMLFHGPLNELGNFWSIEFVRTGP